MSKYQIEKARILCSGDGISCVERRNICTLEHTRSHRSASFCLLFAVRCATNSTPFTHSKCANTFRMFAQNRMATRKKKISRIEQGVCPFQFLDFCASRQIEISQITFTYIRHRCLLCQHNWVIFNGKPMNGVTLE